MSTDRVRVGRFQDVPIFCDNCGIPIDQFLRRAVHLGVVAEQELHHLDLAVGDRRCAVKDDMPDAGGILHVEPAAEWRGRPRHRLRFHPRQSSKGVGPRRRQARRGDGAEPSARQPQPDPARRLRRLSAGDCRRVDRDPALPRFGICESSLEPLPIIETNAIEIMRHAVILDNGITFLTPFDIEFERRVGRLV
jgi:hypothetical protein